MVGAPSWTIKRVSTWFGCRKAQERIAKNATKWRGNPNSNAKGGGGGTKGETLHRLGKMLLRPRESQVVGGKTGTKKKEDGRLGPIDALSGGYQLISEGGGKGFSERLWMSIADE